MDVHELREMVVSLSRAKHVLDTSELAQVKLLSRIICEETRNDVAKLVQENPHACFCLAYGSDGWSGLITQKTIEEIQMEEHVVVGRSGSCTTNFAWIGDLCGCGPLAAELF